MCINIPWKPSMPFKCKFACIFSKNITIYAMCIITDNIQK